jgi:hypothetical protein
VAASLKNEPGVEVQVVNGDRGEFTVSVENKSGRPQGRNAARGE